MEKLVCDICERTELYCRYSIRKIWRFFKRGHDYQGRYNYTLDICDDCFNRIKKQSLNNE